MRPGFAGSSGDCARHSCRIAAESIAQEPRNAADRGHADPRQDVDAPLGQVLLQHLHDLPAIHQRLQFRGRAQVLEKAAALADVLQADDRTKQRVFVAAAFGFGVFAVRLQPVGRARLAAAEGVGARASATKSATTTSRPRSS